MEFNVIQLFDQAKQLVETNNVISGGLMLTAMGVGVAFLRNLPQRIYTSIYHRLISTVTVEGADSTLFDWVDQYLTYKTGNKQHSLAYTRRKDDKERSADPRPNIYFAPARGSQHWLKHDGIWLTFSRRSEGGKQSTNGDIDSSKLAAVIPRLDSYNLTFFTRDKARIESFFHSCRDFAEPLDSRITIRVSNYDFWTIADRTMLRSLDSVIMPEGLAEKVLADLEEFKSLAGWYRSLGVPYRRGYMLYGPPGNGKSSLIAGLACKLRMNVNVLRLNSSSMSDNNLLLLMNDTDTNTILVIEDIDCVTSQREIKDDNGLSFSGLLNALDGLQAKDGRIIFMTTNHIEKLDPALVRKGRVDMKIEVPNADSYRAAKMFQRFFPNHEPPMDLLSIANQGHLSMADLQGIFMQYKDKPEELNASSFVGGNQTIPRTFPASPSRLQYEKGASHGSHI